MALLGFTSPPVQCVAPSACDSYIGGSLLHFEDAAPLPNLYSCINCRGLMCFFGHIYCPVTESAYHRAICLFVCLRPECQEKGLNWRVLRSQYLGSTNTSKPTSITSWHIAAGDENSDNDWEGEVELPCERPTNETESTLLRGPFLCSFIDVYEEGTESSVNEQSEVEAGSVNSGPSLPDVSSFAAWSQADAVEREFVDEDDNALPSAFSGALETHLATRGEHGCEDIRYWWAGRPIFNGPPPSELAERLKCERCGSRRVFELQLFSTINNHLTLSSETDCNDYQLPDTDQINPDWLLRITTVLLFSCSASCWTDDDKWVEECVVVQTDGDRTCIWDGVSPTFVGNPL